MISALKELTICWKVQRSICMWVNLIEKQVGKPLLPVRLLVCSRGTSFLTVCGY